MNGELPEGWANPRLADVAEIALGKMLDKARRTRGIPLPYLRNANVRWNDFDLADLLDMPFEDHELERFAVEAGDLMVCEGGEPGRAAVWPGGRRKVKFQKALLRVRPLAGIDPRWVMHSLRRDAASGALETHFTGSTIKHFPLQAVREYRVPLPPLAEQRRIVSAVEALLARVNAAKQRLDRMPGILKRFRQAVLAAACSGRLTEEWREKHAAPHPAGEALCERRATGANGQRGRGTRAPAEPVDAAALPEIPDCWVWARLPELGELNRGKSRHRPRNAPHLLGGPYPFVQTGDVARSGGRITVHSQTYSEAGLAQSRLWPARTVCITIAANIADSALLSYPACFPDSVVGFVADEGCCLPEYVEFFVRTARRDLSQFAPATAQKNINLEILREVAVPVPPVEEQREIVCRVERLFALADLAGRQVQAATGRSSTLAQAALAKAFRGELVPTEAELARLEGRRYESAEELLQRMSLSSANADGGPSAPTRRARIRKVRHG